MRQLRNHQRYWCLRALLDDLQLEMQASGRFVDEELVSLQRGRWRVLSAVKEGVQEERAWRTQWKIGLVLQMTIRQVGEVSER